MMSMMSLDDLRNDLSEMEKMLTEAARQRVKSILTVEIHKLRTEISKMMEEAAKSQENSKTGSADKPTSATSKIGKYPTKITTYAWDQSDKFFKIYVTLNGVQNISKENVVLQFTDSSFKLEVNDLDGKDYTCHVVQLFEEIDPDKSYHKVKSDMVLVMLKKKSEQTWAYVTKQEAKSKQTKTPKPATNDKDPQGGMMDLMKQMYDDGDDEMKRTITKAMYESQNKKSSELDMSANMANMGNMGNPPGAMF